MRAAVEARQVKLWTTSQAHDELATNRENKLAEAMKALQALRLPTKAPQIARNMPEYDGLMKARREYDQHLNGLQEELVKQFDDRTLAADTVLSELKEVATTIDVSEEILHGARRRHEVGNPPGKRDSLGDAINWECLLSGLPDGVDVYVITGDADFASPLDKDKIAQFLGTEWMAVKSVAGTNLDAMLFRGISAFFREHFPDIKRASEFEKQVRVKALVESPSFDATHRAIAKLSSFDPTDFTEEQVKDLLEAGRWNSQILWISRDSDVRAFYRALLDAHSDNLKPAEAARYREYLLGETAEGDDRVAEAPADGDVDLDF